MDDAILTAMDIVLLPQFKMAKRSMNESSGQGPSSVAQNPHRKDFSGNYENTPLMSASRRSHLNIEQERYGETRNARKFKGGKFPALRHNYNRQPHALNMVTGHNALQNSILEFLIGRIVIENSPWPQQFTQPQKFATPISRDSTLPLVEQTPQRQNSDSGNPFNRLAEAIAGIAFQEKP